jgi:hypothetical protein
MRSILRDERGILASYLIKLVLGLAILGLVVVEGGSILFAHLRVRDAAESAAQVGANAFDGSRNVDAARDAARQEARNRGARLAKPFTVQPVSGRVEVTVVGEANTLLVKHIGFIDQWAVVRVTQSATPSEF